MKIKNILKSMLTFLIVIVCSMNLIACSGKNKGGETDTISIYLPDGTPALALANVLNNNFNFSDKKTNVNIVTADTITGAFAAGADIAIMPTIVGAKLYSTGTDIKLISTNVFGNLYVMSVNTSCDSLQSMVGKVVYVTVGTTLNLLKYELEQNGLSVNTGAEATSNSVTLNSVSDASTIITSLKLATSNGNSNEVLGVLGEPQVTKAKSMVNGLVTVVDMQTEWKNITGFDGYPQASVFAKTSFIQNNKAYIDKLVNALNENANFATEHCNELPKLFERYDSNLKNMTFDTDTITNCNLNCVTAIEIKSSVMDYIGRLAPTSVLDDNFFYSTQG